MRELHTQLIVVEAAKIETGCLERTSQQYRPINWISCENTRGGKERGRTGREGKREGGTDLRRLVVSVIELEMSVNPEWKYH